MLEIKTNHFIDLPENFFKVKNNLIQNYRLDSDHLAEIKFLFSPLNPFFKEGKAYVEVVEDRARAALLIHPDYSMGDNPIAYLAYFECENEKNLCKQLLRRCEDIAKENGIHRIIGPINFNTYHQYRINLNLEQKDPFFNEPKNPPYYGHLLEQNGYQILNKYVSYIVENKTTIEKWLAIYGPKKSLLVFDNQYEYISLTPSLWMKNLAEIHQKSEMIFNDNFAYTATDFNLFSLKYGEQFSQMFCPLTSILVKHKTDGLVGILLNFPNYEDLKENLQLDQQISFDNYMQNVKSPTLLLKTLGLLPNHRQLGYQILRMLIEVTPNALENYDRYIFCMMQKENYPAKLGSEFKDEEKHYALYYKDLK